MIVTSLKRSYPNLLDDVRKGRQSQPLEIKLESITRGYWKKINESTLDGFRDFVVGTYDNMIVSAYKFEWLQDGPDGTVKFDGPGVWDEKPAGDNWFSPPSSNFSQVPGEWLIGCPVPGGPWRQGESRGTRRYSMETYLADHPELSTRVEEDFGGRMATNLVDHLATGKAIPLEDYPQLASATSMPGTAETGVTVVRQPGGTVVITIPTGTRAQLLIEPEGGMIG